MTKNHGYTLIELLIVVTLSVMLLLTASALFMTFLGSNAKTNSQQAVKNEGSYAQTQLEFLIRNAVDVPVGCDGAPQTSLTVKAQDNSETTLTNTNNRIASNSSFLTSDTVQVTGPTFVCTSQSGGLAKYVGFTYTVSLDPSGVGDQQELATETFTGGVSIRSY